MALQCRNKILSNSNDIDPRIMRYEDDGLDIFSAVIGSPGHRESDASAMCKCEHCRHRLGLACPPDALTRLLMDADSVPEIVLERLLQRIAATQSPG
jgi:hypothetical protein